MSSHGLGGVSPAPRRYGKGGEQPRVRLPLRLRVYEDAKADVAKHVDLSEQGGNAHPQRGRTVVRHAVQEHCFRNPPLAECKR